MKTVRYVLSLMLFVSVLLLTGCNIRYNVSCELNNECIYTLDGEITSLEIGGGADVVVDTTVAKNQVRVLANTDDFSKLVVKEEGDRLMIYHKRNTGNREYKVYVPACGYKVLAVSGGSDLEWNYCDVDDLAVTVSGGADCEIKGRCNSLAVAASGGADVDLEKLVAYNVSVVASGGADTNLCAVKTIAVTASGGSDVYIEGTPQITGWSVSGGADVHIKK